LFICFLIRKGGFMILVVEDNPMLARMIHRILLRNPGLKAEEANIICASNKAEGLELFRKNKDRLRAIILDYEVPGDDGINNTESLLVQIREAGFSGIIVASSGLEENSRKLVELGATCQAQKSEVSKALAKAFSGQR